MDAVSVSIFLPSFVRLAKDLVHEAQMHKLRHPNIVMLLAVIFEPGHYGVVFEYVTYGGLDSFIEDYLVSFILLGSQFAVHVCLCIWMIALNKRTFDVNIWHDAVTNLGKVVGQVCSRVGEKTFLAVHAHYKARVA